MNQDTKINQIVFKNICKGLLTASALMMLTAYAIPVKADIPVAGALKTSCNDQSYALAASAEGSVIVGYRRDKLDDIHAFRWTEATGMQRLVACPER